MHMLESVDLERRLSIYSKCIFIAVNKGYSKDVMYNLEGIEFSYYDIVNICHYVIDVYGNESEKKKYKDLYENMDIIIDRDYVKKLYYDRLGYIYEIKKNYGNDKNILKKKAKIFKFNVSDINKLCYEYIVDYLKFDKLEYEWFMYLIGKKNCNVKVNMSFSMLLELLCKFDSEEDIIDLINYSGYNICNSSYSKIDSYIDSYCSDKSELEKEEISKSLKEKFALYIKYNNKNKVINKEESIRDFIDSNYYSVTDYCRDNDLKVNTFCTRAKSISKTNRKLYDRYLIKINKGYNSESDSYIYRMLCYWIVSGFNNREIDLLDLFSIKGFSFNKLENVAINCLNRKEFLIVSEYIQKCNNQLKELLVKRDNSYVNEKTISYIKDKFYKYDIDFSLLNVAIDRLNKGIELDDLVINMINEVVNNKCKEKVL